MNIQRDDVRIAKYLIGYYSSKRYLETEKNLYKKIFRYIKLKFKFETQCNCIYFSVEIYKNKLYHDRNYENTI